jgi:uncharacterized protein YcbK (DUF882 family)
MEVNPKLVDLLEEIRTKVGKPITIMSGKRCEAHNAKVGGAKKSQHVLGNAADIKIKDMTAQDVQGYLETVFGDRIGGLGSYKTFTHIDVREGHARWRG